MFWVWIGLLRLSQGCDGFIKDYFMSGTTSIKCILFLPLYSHIQRDMTSKYFFQEIIKFHKFIIIYIFLFFQLFSFCSFTW